MKVLWIGAAGIIGQHARLCIPAGVEAVFARYQADLLHLGLDIIDADALYAFLDEHKPDGVINLAGENRPDVVERDPNAYHAVNCIAPARIAAWCHEHGAHYVHVSTQGVFGKISSSADYPIHPLSERRPVNAYGEQKLQAEIIVRRLCPDTTVVRPSFVLGVRPLPLVGRENPVERWLAPPKLALEGETIGQFREVNNRWFSVSFAWDVAAQLWDAAANLEGTPQVIHIGIPCRVSRYGLAKYLRGDEVEPVNHEDFPGIAERPRDTTYAGRGRGSWEEIEAGLEMCAAQYRSRERLGRFQRAREISIFTGTPERQTVAKLMQGFLQLHNEVSDDFRSFNPTNDTQLLEWYSVTDSYVWELSAYHCDEGFNYAGMIQGIAESLKAKGSERVLCLGDGIGDLTIVLRQAGMNGTYHDLDDSRTSAFSVLRQNMYLGYGNLNVWTTEGWAPDIPDGWDAIVSLDYLEHLPNVEEWLRAIYAALKPGGWFLAQNAFGCGSEGPMPMHLQCNDRYVTEYGPLMAAIGFQIEGTSNWWKKQA